LLRTSNKNASSYFFGGKRIILSSECHEHYVPAFFHDLTCTKQSLSVCNPKHSLSFSLSLFLSHTLSLSHTHTFPTHIRYSGQKGGNIRFPSYRWKRSLEVTVCIRELDWTLVKVVKFLLLSHFWPLLKWVICVACSLPEIASSLKSNYHIVIAKVCSLLFSCLGSSITLFC